MPRTNRFSPTFAERQRQSRVARGQEQAAPEIPFVPPTVGIFDEWSRDLLRSNDRGLAALMSARLDRITGHFLDRQAGSAQAIGNMIHDAVVTGVGHGLVSRDGVSMAQVAFDPTPPILFVPGSEPGHIPIPTPPLNVPTMPELHALATAAPVATPQYPQHPSAQLAAPMTYLDVIERQVEAFMSVLPLLKSLWGSKRYGAIDNYSSPYGYTSSVATIDVYIETPNKLVSRSDIAAMGFRCRVIPGSSRTNVELYLPTTMLRDARVLPHLAEMTHLSHHNVPVEPKHLYLRPDGAHGSTELIAGVYLGAVSTIPRPGYADPQLPLTTPLWEVRERIRLLTGDYVAMPPEALQMLDPQHATTFAHLATKLANRGMVAYTRDSNAGQLDRQQTIKPGRFFKQYGLDTTDQRAKEFSAIIAGALPFGIKVLSTREEYSWAYAKGPESCMCKGSTTNNKEKFGYCYVDGDWVHPVEVFAHPESDLRLVVVAEDDRIGARTWINQRTKQWARQYTNNNIRGAQALLADWLETEGYRQSDNWCDGQPLLRLDSDDGGIICPYIDPSNYGVAVKGDRLVLGEGCEQANHETGHLSDYDADGRREGQWTCDHCNDTYDDDDSSYQTLNECTICEHCSSHSYTSVETTNGDVYYVRDDRLSNTAHLYDARHLRSADEPYIYISRFDRTDIVMLDEGHYDNCVAQRDDCVLTNEGTWVLDEDASDFDLLYVERTGYFTPDDECCVLIDADGNATLDEESGADLDDLEETSDLDPLEFNSDWGGMTVYAHPDYLQSLEEVDPEPETEAA